MRALILLSLLVLATSLLAVTPIMADITLSVKPKTAPVGTPIEIYIKAADGQPGVYIDKGDFTVTDPKGNKHECSQQIFLFQITVKCVYPSADYFPGGTVDIPGIYLVELRWHHSPTFYYLETTFIRYKTCGGDVTVAVGTPTDEFDLLDLHISVVSTLIATTVGAIIYTKHTKRKETNNIAD